MKKFFYLFLATCVSLISCSKTESTGSGEQKSTPVVTFSYSQSGVIKDMTMILTVDGKEYKFDKDSDKQSIALTQTSGTIKFDCKVDETKTYTDKQSLSASINVIAGSVSASGTGYSSMTNIVMQNFMKTGIKADAVTKHLNNIASVLVTSKTYSVDANGKVSVK